MSLPANPSACANGFINPVQNMVTGKLLIMIPLLQYALQKLILPTIKMAAKEFLDLIWLVMKTS